jgi:iron complex transport system substrate-binding protein
MSKALILFVAALAFLGGGAVAGEAGPRRVMSLNLCTDQFVLQLLPPERIASVTYLSRASNQSFFTAEAARVPVNYGSAEEVLAYRPDVVIAGNVTTPATRDLLKKIGASLIEVPPANSFDEIRSITRSLGTAFREEAKAEALIAKMDSTLAGLAAGAPKQRIVVAILDESDRTPGPGTLEDAILTAAGGVNITASLRQPIRVGNYASFDLEQIVMLHPDIVAYGQSRAIKPGIMNEKIQHPVLRELFGGHRITFPETLYSCGLPQSADAAVALRQPMLAAMASTKAAP